MKLWIPKIGDVFELEQCWTFLLINEPRNEGLFGDSFFETGKLQHVVQQRWSYSDQTKQDIENGLKEWYENIVVEETTTLEDQRCGRRMWKQEFDMRLRERYKDKWFVLPQGTVLRVDRVYIRAGGASADKFSSLTFRIISCPDLNIGRVRFFAKLEHVNLIEYCNPQVKTYEKKEE